MLVIYSIFYKFIRRVVIVSTTVIQLIKRVPKHLEDAIKIGDFLLDKVYPFTSSLYRYKAPKLLSQDVYNLKFPSPLTVASFKYHESTIRFWLNLGMGGATLKTITKDVRNGNDIPRIQELKPTSYPSLLNAMGLPGPGVDEFCKEISRWKIWNNQTPIGISIGGHSTNDYCAAIDCILNKLPTHILSKVYIELNISCPNTPEGQNISKKPELLEPILSHLRDLSSIPCSVKVSPDQQNEELQKTADICKKYTNMMINCGNTQYKSCRAVGLNENAISIGGGGLSGASLFDRTLEMVTLFARYELPIIATGGVTSIDRCVKVLEAGATLIGMATQLVADPFMIPKINNALARRNKTSVIDY